MTVEGLEKCDKSSSSGCSSSGRQVFLAFSDRLEASQRTSCCWFYPCYRCEEEFKVPRSMQTRTRRVGGSTAALKGSSIEQAGSRCQGR